MIAINITSCGQSKRADSAVEIEDRGRGMPPGLTAAAAVGQRRARRRRRRHARALAAAGGLVLTIHHSERLARDALQAGARGYVMKSDADQSLIGAVESLRQHKPFLTSKVTEFVLDDYIRRGELREDAPRDAITPREREVIQLLAEGNSNKETASALGVSVKAIEAHRANMMRKRRLRSVTDLVRSAIRNKIRPAVRRRVSCRIRPGVSEPSHKRLIGRKVTVRFVVDLRRRPR